MSIKTLILTVSVLGATGSTLAQEYVAPEPFVGTKSRAEVIAELEQARKDGTLEALDRDYPATRLAGGTKTREEVKAELAEARLRGTPDVLTNDYPVLEAPRSSKTRAEVRAELSEFQRAHPNERTNNI